jgi:ferredoxin
MPHIRADVNLCQGYGNCIASAGELFDLSDTDVVEVLRPEVGEDERGRAVAAARSCPVSAITISD